MKIPQSTLWYLYDFANSFASIVVFFYFPLLFVSKGGFELWMGIASSVSTLALMFVLPGIARRIDRTGKRIFPLIVSSVGMSVILGILGYAF
jgi:MFS-type transporter involved in bile tolerance (Atg22 family)